MFMYQTQPTIQSDSQYSSITIFWGGNVSEIEIHFLDMQFSITCLVYIQQN